MSEWKKLDLYEMGKPKKKLDYLKPTYEPKPSYFSTYLHT
jgi:hypothetical protein